MCPLDSLSGIQVTNDGVPRFDYNGLVLMLAKR